MSLSLAGGASASTGGPAADITPQNISPNHEIFLGEEEITDVSLSTFHVFDRENTLTPQAGEKVAYWRGCGCRGCRCGGCRCGLEAMLGVRWLRRLLQILGPLSLVLMRSGS